MKIDENAYVAMEYALSLDSGEVVDRSSEEEPLEFIFGAGQVIAGLERGLKGMEPGQRSKITVEAEDAYGVAKQELQREIPRANFPEGMELEPGMGFEARGPHGPVTFRVISSDADNVLADFNHPLAGQRLHFDVHVVEVREPRAEELAQLHAHPGEDGCSPSACSSCSGSCG